MDSLVVNGSMSFDSTVIWENFVNFYNRLYSKQFSWRLKLDGLSLLSFEADERNWLERDFEGSEVLEVVRDLNGDKAPGLDGFSTAFFQKC